MLLQMLSFATLVEEGDASLAAFHERRSRVPENTRKLFYLQELLPF